MGDSTAKEIDKEVRALVDRGHEKALEILHHNRGLLEDIAQRILEEVIEGDDSRNCCPSVDPEPWQPECLTDFPLITDK